MIKEIFINSSEEMINLGKKIGEGLKANMVIALNGDLGAGKTTFTKGIALALDIKKVVNSPTFVIMKIYYGNLTLFHLDVYRVNESEFELSEYFEDGGVCVVEWADNIKAILPDEYLNITISDIGDDKRKVIVEGNEEYLQIVKGL